MPRIAEADCARCGYIYPVNEMHRVSDRVKTGESKRYSRDQYGHSTQSGHTEHFSTKISVLCEPCYRRRVKGQILSFLGLLGVGGVALGVSAMNGGGTRSTVSDTPPAFSQPANLLEEVRPEADAEGYATSPPSADRSADSTPTAIDVPSADADASAPSEPVVPEVAPAAPAPALALGDIAAAAEAGRRALASGKPERWHEGKLKGYAVPSEQAVNGCRQITLSEDNAAAPQSTSEMCE